MHFPFYRNDNFYPNNPWREMNFEKRFAPRGNSHNLIFPTLPLRDPSIYTSFLNDHLLGYRVHIIWVLVVRRCSANATGIHVALALHHPCHYCSRRINLGCHLICFFLSLLAGSHSFCCDCYSTRAECNYYAHGEYKSAHSTPDASRLATREQDSTNNNIPVVLQHSLRFVFFWQQSHIHQLCKLNQLVTIIIIIIFFAVNAANALHCCGEIILLNLSWFLLLPSASTRNQCHSRISSIWF